MAKLSAAEIITRHATELRKIRDHANELLVDTLVTASPGELREVADAAQAVAEAYNRIRAQVTADIPGSIMAVILADATSHYELVSDEWAGYADEAAKRAGGTQ